MKQIFSMCLATFLLFAGCAGANDGNENSSLLLLGISDKSLLDIAANPQRSLANLAGSGVYYVDALAGDDSNPGTSLAPYKTITYAVSQPGKTIYVAPGTYDEALGETFPIKIPVGMNLIGNESGKGIGTEQSSGYTGAGINPNEGPTLILGAGPTSSGSTAYTTLALGNNSTIAGFTITNLKPIYNSNNMAVQVLGELFGTVTGITIRNNTVTGTVLGVGIFVPSYNNPASIGNTISGNTITSNQNGIYYNLSSAVIKVENNLISRNRWGITIGANTNTNPSMDLGGGSTGSTGNNTISCNTDYDLRTQVPNTVTLYAKNNHWDHIPPTSTLLAGEVADILNPSNSSILTSGMSLAASPCNP
ncbi:MULTISPECIES: DUF1565 domain-containing protein [Leptospira]|uniref:LIC10774 family surface protein n=1 Tax=Leptospira TaxID=171 RepID=UPI0002BEE923|nr:MULTISPECIES: DUF1565 domain-containing protein [Leptospira]EMJ64302.1 PF07602 family protein [Leptospira sp. P2653]MDL5245390.1 DUF1565 domain-containing protein [Leptospira weilii]